MKKLLVLSMVLLSFSSCTKENDMLPESKTLACNGKRTVSIQCGGTTQSGANCKNLTLSCNGRCNLHGGN
jgi:hypothetical protein